MNLKFLVEKSNSVNGEGYIAIKIIKSKNLDTFVLLIPFKILCNVLKFWSFLTVYDTIKFRWNCFDFDLRYKGKLRKELSYKIVVHKN